MSNCRQRPGGIFAGSHAGPIENHSRSLTVSLVAIHHLTTLT
jgi:hypothetical protein